MVSSSAAVCVCASSIVDAPPRAGGIEQFFQSESIEKLGPRFRPVDEAVQVLLHARDRILVHEIDIVLHVPEHRLVGTVAFMRRTAEWKLHHRVNGEERN